MTSRRARLAALLGSFLLLAVCCTSATANASVKDVHRSKRGYCSPSGMIDDASCEFETIEVVNKKLAPVLNELVSTSFFRYWKTTLHKDCPFWQENPLCVLRDCSVIEAEESEIPEHWKTSSLSSVDESPLGNPFSFMTKSCEYAEADFCVVEDEASKDGCFVDLIKNPERFTGYDGESPARIWSAIYKENCFENGHAGGSSLGGSGLGGGLLLSPAPRLSSLSSNYNDQCMEKRVFYKLISGLHSSISTHICDQYLDRTSGTWIRNLTCFANRVGNHPDRIHSLYFTYTILLRAITKLAPYLENHEVHHFCTGNGRDTQKIEDLVLETSDITKRCGPTFDETALFSGPGSLQLKNEFKTHFRNISEIMECVGCEKCKLWGKLQISGLGTALKILFSYEDKPELFRLTRGEVVALFNTVHRFSESVSAVDRFRDLHQNQGLNQTVAPELAEESKMMSGLRTKQNASAKKAKAEEMPFDASSPPPLDLELLMAFSDLGDPRYFISYVIGALIVVYGTFKITQRAWQLHTGTLKLPEGWDARNQDEEEDAAAPPGSPTRGGEVEFKVPKGNDSGVPSVTAATLKQRESVKARAKVVQRRVLGPSFHALDGDKPQGAADDNGDEDDEPEFWEEDED
ncbi:hypothetical protein HDU88_004789 [Geranomyces variabilis]|nr:hypothetical protein HDU88_004789 [Geranomyces variabilis]